MNIYPKLLVTAFLLCASFSTYAASISLPQNQWNMLVLPADPPDKSIGNLFGDELGMGDYCDLVNGTGTWCVWTYDAANDLYNNPQLTDSLSLGQAFWILQASAPSIDITLPDGSPQPTDSNDANCTALGGCLDVPLSTDATRNVTWSMVGSPYGWSTDVNDILFETGAGGHPCGTGCSLDVAENTHQLSASFVWIWNPNNASAGDYEQRFAGDLLQPWQAFWAPTLPAADSLLPVLKFPDTAAFADVRGFVGEITGGAASGMTVQLVGSAITTTTDANGEFTLTLPSNQEHVLKFESPDYATQVLVVDIPVAGGRVDIAIDVLKRNRPETFNTANFVNTILGPDGSTVEMFGATFVDGAGNPIIGNVDVSVTPVDVSNVSRRRAFPGSFSGVPENGGPMSTLVSQGTVEFHFTQNGSEVFLGSGDVLISLPIYTPNYPDGSAINIGDSIPLWSLDEDSGVWVQEGTGTVIADARSVSGLSLQGAVTHFSWWNCDVTISPPSDPDRGGAGFVRIFVAAAFQTGSVNIYGSTTASLGWRSTTVSTTANVNTFSGPLAVPAGAEVCFRAEIVFDGFLLSGTPTKCVTVARGETKDVFLGADAILDLFLYAYLDEEPDVRSANSLDVMGYIGVEIAQVNFNVGSIESQVEYTVSDLPPGLTMESYLDVRAKIVGIPTTAGQYTTVVTGENASGNTESITINYDITSDPEPPRLEAGNNVFQVTVRLPSAGTTVVDMLGDHNVGGFAELWTLIDFGFVGGGGIPSEINLDSQTGELTVDGQFQGAFNGLVRAENASGVSEMALFIVDSNGCFGGDCGPNGAFSETSDF